MSLVDPSPAIQLDSIRITRFDDASPVLLGSDKGPREDIAALPEALGVVLESGDDGGFWVSFHVTATGQPHLLGRADDLPIGVADPNGRGGAENPGPCGRGARSTRRPRDAAGPDPLAGLGISAKSPRRSRRSCERYTPGMSRM